MTTQNKDNWNVVIKTYRNADAWSKSVKMSNYNEMIFRVVLCQKRED